MIMASPYFCHPKLVVLMLLLPLATSLLEGSYSPSVHSMLCHAGERSALIQFKKSFVIDKLASSAPLAYPKIVSWNIRGDCCSWDGVDCDDDGHVIGLDLGSSCLYGSISSNSSLFQLKHLQTLDLADNNFNYSPIPPELSLLSTTLTHLNLSRSCFARQIPLEISMLSKLIVLNLGFNADESSSTRYLLLKPPVFTSLVHNMTKLEHLILSWVDISSTVPHIISNLSSLSKLYLGRCNLVGEFPSTVFLLPNLQYISIHYNRELAGYLPQFNHSPLKSLRISYTNFSGPVSSSLGKLTNLTNLDLAHNKFTVGDLSWLAQLINLQSLNLSAISISREIPYSLASLSNLQFLSLNSCHLTGEIPFWIRNHTQLTHLNLGYNFLQGPVRRSIFSKLVNLQFLCLFGNGLSGTLEFGMFHDMLNLTILGLGRNHLTVADYYNGTLPNLKRLDLDSCKLQQFPNFLKHQQKLQWLSLANNTIHGLMPSWFCNTNKETLLNLYVANNSLTGFDQCTGAVSWVNLQHLDLSRNFFRGALPTPPPSIIKYNVRYNGLTGEVPSLFCNLSSLSYLVMDHNSLCGELPRCLGSMTNLSLLALNNNNFSGTIPPMCANVTNRMEVMNFAENQLQGKIPTSLANCAMLRYLNVGHNEINDRFPFWMGKLHGLQLLVLRSNRFHGAIESHASASNSEFPSLRIIDLSHNAFSGRLPSTFFQKLKAMEKLNPIQFAYMQTNTSIIFSMILANKGIEMDYKQIPNVLVAIDFSSNNFGGEVPESMGSLNGLNVLNLSNNRLTGCIPSSFANLTVLESLDLSDNKLSGEIPQQLATLNFLAYFNVSQNNLRGKVPRGTQFDTFQDNSFNGNSGLCGEFLIRKGCRGYYAPALICSDKCEDVESWFPRNSNFIMMALGYAGGLVVGMVMGNKLMTRKPEWFVRVSGRKMQRQRRKGIRWQKLRS